MRGRHKRIDTRMDEATYMRVDAIRKKFGFRGKASAMVALVKIGASLVDSRDLFRDSPAETKQYISEMFKDYSDFEQQPYGKVPVRKHHKTID